MSIVCVVFGVHGRPGWVQFAPYGGHNYPLTLVRHIPTKCAC